MKTRLFNDFIRYTFTPLFGFVLVVLALIALLGMALAFLRNEPLLAVLTFSSYYAIFFTAMLISYLQYNRYLKF